MTTNSKNSYEIGYRKPPKSTQFKPGRSGNPAGRPKGFRNLATIVRSELAQKVEVVENGEKKLISKADIIAKSQVAKAAKGDARAAEFIFKLEHNANFEDQQKDQSLPSQEEDNAIIERFFAQRKNSSDEYRS